MTDDPTQQYPTNAGGDAPAPAGDPAPAAEPTALADTAPATEPPASSSEPAPGSTAPVAPAPAVGASRTKWLVALGVAGVAIAAALAALFLFGKSSAPEALTYIPGDAALVVELRPELPGDQMQTLGNLLAHFPGFQDQSTLPQKIDEALKRLIAQSPRSSVDYEKDVKPFLSGPMFVSAKSFEDMATSDDPKNFVVVATTTGAVTCEKTFEGAQVATESYNGLTLSISSDQKMACTIDGRFAIVGDPAGVKAAIDTKKAGAGADKAAQYQAARTQLGLDRLATIYMDGVSFAKALSGEAASAVGSQIADVFPAWVMIGVRAENDALVTDVVVAPAANPSALPSMLPNPPVHPISMTAFAPAETIVFVEAQGFGVSLQNGIGQLTGDPMVAEALKALATFGGIEGMVGWIDDAGVIVLRDGEMPAGGVVLGTRDAATASEKVTALTTVLGLGAVGGDLEVTTSTVEGVTVTTVHIPDISVLAGAAGGGAAIPAVPLDFSVAAKDRYVMVGIGTNAMAKLLGVKAGSGLADDAAFKRALTRALPNPQVVIYVAAGAGMDWLESTAGALGTPALPADLKAYLDPVEGFIYSTTGDALKGGSLRFALTVANP